MPYYLHQLDRVRGAAHFEVPIARGLELIDVLQTRLPGYAVPRYVCERAGTPYKIPLTLDHRIAPMTPSGLMRRRQRLEARN